MADWFDQNTYLDNKVKQMNAAGESLANGSPVTNESVLATMTANGLSPETHYQQYGRAEGVNPFATSDFGYTMADPTIISTGAAPQIGYTDASGNIMSTSNVTAAEILKNTARYGIDLSKLGSLGTVNGLDLSSLSQGQMPNTTQTANGTEINFTQDPALVQGGVGAMDRLREAQLLAQRYGINGASVSTIDDRPDNYATGGVEGNIDPQYQYSGLVYDPNNPNFTNNPALYQQEEQARRTQDAIDRAKAQQLAHPEYDMYNPGQGVSNGTGYDPYNPQVGEPIYTGYNADGLVEPGNAAGFNTWTTSSVSQTPSGQTMTAANPYATSQNSLNYGYSPASATYGNATPGYTSNSTYGENSPAGSQVSGVTGQTTGTNPAMTAFGENIAGLKKGSYSGLPEQYNNQLLGQAVPQLLESLKNYRSDIDNSTKASQELYGQMANEAMKVKAQDILNGLSSRGIFKGDVVSDAMGTGLSDVAREYANKGFESSQAAAAMKAQEPTLLSQAVNLGQTSESFNQLAPFEFLRDFYLGMQ